MKDNTCQDSLERSIVRLDQEKEAIMNWTCRMALLIPGVLIVLLLMGCSSLGVHPEAMSPAQLKEAVKDKNGSVICGKVTTVGGTAETRIINLDSGVIQNGGLTVDQNCSVQILNQRITAPVLPKPGV